MGKRSNVKDLVIAVIREYFEKNGSDRMLHEHLHRQLVAKFPMLMSCHLWTQIGLQAKVEE